MVTDWMPVLSRKRCKILRMYTATHPPFASYFPLPWPGAASKSNLPPDRPPSTDTATDIGTSPAASNILLDLQAHRINATRCCGTGFDREAPIYKKEEKISVDMTGEPVVR